MAALAVQQPAVLQEAEVLIDVRTNKWLIELFEINAAQTVYFIEQEICSSIVRRPTLFYVYNQMGLIKLNLVDICTSHMRVSYDRL